MQQPAVLAVLLAAVGFNGTACSPIYGAPAAHVPLFRQAGELHASGAYGNAGYSGSIAFAPFDHMSVLIEGQIDADGSSQRFTGGVGAGYFNPFGERGVVEMMVGVSYGATEGELVRSSGNAVQAEGPLLRVYGQGAVGMRSGFFDLGAAVRASYVRIEVATPRDVSDRQNVFAEPTFFVRLGYEWLKLEAQVGTSLPILNTLAPTQTLVHFAVGLVGHFDLGSDLEVEAGSSTPAPEIEPIIP